MPALAALLLCAAALAAAVAAPATSQYGLFSSHMRRALGFRCHEPQPRAFLSSAMVKANTTDTVNPPYTVLHRCDGSSGCCESQDHVCDVRDSQEVTLLFIVSDTVNNRQRFHEATFTNHTRCHCVSREPQPPK